ncbi:MAG: MFS transporter, partial [Acidimicrobiales bacterium]
STLKAGLVLVPQAAVLMVVAPMSNVIVRRIGSKLVVAFGLCVVGLSLALFSTLTPHSTMAHVIGISILMAVGMGNVMAPATESIMGSLPRDKAGVGSAVNDTTRQVGGAVGVAVFGSLLASRYSSGVRSDLRGVLPARTLGHASDSIGRAYEVVGSAKSGAPGAAKLSGPQLGQVIDSAKHNFVAGMHTTAIVASVILLVAMLGVVKFLPAGHRDEEAGGDVTDSDGGRPATPDEPPSHGARPVSRTVGVSDGATVADREDRDERVPATQTD